MLADLAASKASSGWAGEGGHDGEHGEHGEHDQEQDVEPGPSSAISSGIQDKEIAAGGRAKSAFDGGGSVFRVRVANVTFELK